MKIRMPRDPRRGFTLLELLIVLVIIAVVTAAALPVVLPALANRRVSEGSRVFQAVLAGVRDQAIRSGEPRGIRLLPSVMHDGSGETLAYNRMIAIEPGPDYSEGRVTVAGDPYIITGLGVTIPPRVGVASAFLPFYPAVYTSGVWSLAAGSNPTPPMTGPPSDCRLAIYQSQSNYNTATNTSFPDTPTGWYWNIRQGDRIVIGDTGRAYTIAGPMIKNPGDDGNIERFINAPPAATGNPDPTSGAFIPEVLYLVNGQDDDGDGWIDESFDGLDNDGDGIVDPGFNGINDDGVNGIDDPMEVFWNARTRTYSGTEYEQETFVGASLTTSQLQGDYASQKYLIKRRAVVSPQAKEVYLPDGVLIDATSWNATRTVAPSAMPERSRLPIDPFSRTVDIMLMPSGAAVPPNGPDSLNSPSTYLNVPFFHFWICDASDVLPGIWTRPNNWPVNVPPQNPSNTQIYTLAMPKGTVKNATDSTPYAGGASGIAFLEGERRLVTLFTKTGQVSTSRIELFYTDDVNTPYYDAQTGVTEEP